jgi:hypothetical protein
MNIEFWKSERRVVRASLEAEIGDRIASRLAVFWGVYNARWMMVER